MRRGATTQERVKANCNGNSLCPLFPDPFPPLDHAPALLPAKDVKLRLGLRLSALLLTLETAHCHLSCSRKFWESFPSQPGPYTAKSMLLMSSLKFILTQDPASFTPALRMSGPPPSRSPPGSPCPTRCNQMVPVKLLLPQTPGH